MNASPSHLVELGLRCPAQLCWPAAGQRGRVPSLLHTALPIEAHEMNCKIYPVLSSKTLLALLEEEEEPVSFLICEIYD